MQPTEQQQAIYDEIATMVYSPRADSNSIFINAGAGCGKTTTIVQAASYFSERPRDLLYLAFNKSIADELSLRLPDGISASTFHSCCLRALSKSLPKRPTIDKWKTRVITKVVIPDDRYEHYQYCVPRLVSLAKNAGILALVPNEVETFIDLAETHNIEKDSMKTDWHEAGKYCVEIIKRSYKSLDVIDFDDMLWLTFVRSTPLFRFPFIFTDESQDLNAVQLGLLARMSYTNNGLVIAVGDPHQAIYGFRGALSDSVGRMIDKFDMTEMPLSYSFRCAKRIIKVAQEFNPKIQAMPNASEGIVDDLDIDWSIESFQPGDAILCRTNAPVVRLAFQLLAARRQCYIEGREYGEQMIQLVKKINPSTIQDLPGLLDAWVEAQPKSQMLEDKCEAIRSLIPGCNNIGDLLTLIDTLFTKKPDAITLSSVHKSKGLEWNRVWALGWHSLMPHPKADPDNPQEMNLKYVLATRAKRELYFIEPLRQGA